jgi:hypothetical protein
MAPSPIAEVVNSMPLYWSVAPMMLKYVTHREREHGKVMAVAVLLTRGGGCVVRLAKYLPTKNACGGAVYLPHQTPARSGRVVPRWHGQHISDRLDSNVEEAFARRARGVANDALLHLIEKAVTTHSEVVMVILRSLSEMPTLSTETDAGA